MVRRLGWKKAVNQRRQGEVERMEFLKGCRNEHRAHMSAQPGGSLHFAERVVKRGGVKKYGNENGIKKKTKGKIAGRCSCRSSPGLGSRPSPSREA